MIDIKLVFYKRTSRWYDVNWNVTHGLVSNRRKTILGKSWGNLILKRSSMMILNIHDIDDRNGNLRKTLLGIVSVILILS